MLMLDAYLSHSVRASMEPLNLYYEFIDRRGTGG